jgi:tetratricopeptide (TPR) repeat protein
MLASIAGEQVPWSLAEAVHRQTEGNPLFVQEVMRYLAEEGVFVRDKGRWQAKGDTPVEMRIPDGLRDVIGKRLSSLSESCNKVLSVAAVIGRDFRLEVLQKVAGMTEEEIFKALEEARKAAVIEERTGTGAVVNYRFAHAFFRQTLYEEIIAPRRIRLHQQVARALEEVYKAKLEEHAAELAEHFSHSSDSADLSKAVSYGEMAAKRATSVYAYSEAVRLLDQAIKVQEILDPDDKGKRCDLLLDLCDALLLATEFKRILEAEAPTAFTLAEVLDDGSRASRACQIAFWVLINQQAGPGWATPQAAEWAQRADRHARPETNERAIADAALGSIKCATGHLPSGIKLLNQALELAHNLKVPNTLFMVGFNMLLFQTAPQHAKESVKLAEELMASSRFGVNLFLVAIVLEMAGHAFLTVGNRKKAEKLLGEQRVLKERTNQSVFWIASTAMDALLILMDGRLEEVLEKARSIRARGEEAEVPVVSEIHADLAGFRARVYLGRSLDAMERGLRRRTAEIDNRFALNAGFCLVLGLLGQKGEASEILERGVVRRPNIGTFEDKVFTYVDALYLEAAVITGHRIAAELLLNRFTGTGVCTSGIWYPTCILRHLGGAAALLGRYEEARQHYQEAIRVCTDMRFRPELALSRLELAELLLKYYLQEKSEAIAHLDFCIPEFRDMKMQPSLERALRHKEILKA